MTADNLLQSTIERIVDDLNYHDLKELIDMLPTNTKHAAKTFCDRFELDDWFYDSMLENEVDIVAALSDICAVRSIEEEIANLDAAEIEQDYRRAVIG